MKNISKKKHRTKKNYCVRIVLALIGTVVLGIGVYAGIVYLKHAAWRTPEELLAEYMAYIPKEEYEKMYEMLNMEVSGNITQEDFIKRNSAIYEGIEIRNMAVDIIMYDEKENSVTYRTSFDTAAGNISFENEAVFTEGKKGYELVWEDSLIFPELYRTDKIRVSTVEAKRGRILDRNGRVLAGQGVASSVGIVPGKFVENENVNGQNVNGQNVNGQNVNDQSVNGQSVNDQNVYHQLAELLEINPEVIKEKLSASWVKEDSFVPIKTIPKVKELELMSVSPDEKALEEKGRQDMLLEIPGIMITDIEVREYPFGEATAHLTGYVQGVTAEDLEEHAGEGYTANSVIGRSGMEGLFEKELKGQNGCKIYITDGDGNEKTVLANQPVSNGQDVQLTIDVNLQTAIYEQFREDKSCTVAMHPFTGEVLALVSTPSFDNNDFIRGLSDEKWADLNESEDKPMYNRFRQAWCPGSVFKPITAAIGLESGAINPAEDYGNVGLSWQKDSSWGSYYVTTLHAYEPVILENALIYSDNIYFAKAALKIGAEELENSLTRLGFSEELPFEIKMAQSQYSNTENIETEIQLADSGYGQGQILVNPLHMASIYSAFCNDGNIIKPYLVYRQDRSSEFWIPNAFGAGTAGQVLEGTKKVVNDPNGTGYAAHREDVILAGKTGTAEIKASKEDTSGTELGWFAVFTPEKTVERPVLMISMVEDVKDRGGSGYVVEKDSLVLENWFYNN